MRSTNVYTNVINVCFPGCNRAISNCEGNQFDLTYALTMQEKITVIYRERESGLYSPSDGH